MQAGSTESAPYLTREERRLLIDHCDPSIADFAGLLNAIGARPIELIRATVADYDKRSSSLTLWDMKGRGSKRIRHVPLKALPAALDIVKRITASKLPSAPLFVPATDTQFYLLPFRAAVKAAGINEEATAYSLRHSFISDALAGGVPALTVARIVGSSLQQIQQTYGKLIEDHAVAAFAKISGS